MTLRIALAVFCLGVLAGVAEATPVLTMNGYLNDAGNVDLVGSGPAPDAPLFGSDFDIANNVAIRAFTLAAASTVTFDSNGYDAGGVDPYFTLFEGATPSTATFIASNYAQAFSTGGDFVISLALAPGDYFVALGAFANESLAENLGGGTLADGFTGLGFGSLGTYYYELDVTSDAATPVPEPSTLTMLGLALVAGARRWRGRLQP